jgi:DNA-binding transcriptional MerR regulator/methylmalonyl-CoA mutase cobalamin-binding subunit
MHTVKRAAELTGVAPDTLRAWERRYGVVVPQRSEGGYRLYDDLALRRLAAMKALVDGGWSTAQAARRVLDEVSDDADDGTPDPITSTVGDVDALARVGRDLDGVALEAALDEGFAAGSFEQVADGWLMPALYRLGSGWRSGEVGVAGEHFVSAAVQRRLAALFDAASCGATGPVAVVGLARGSRHELGVLAFAVALRRVGLDVVYVGGDLPPEAWVSTVRSRGAALAVIGVPAAEDVPAVRETVAALRQGCPDVHVSVGGGHQDAVVEGAELLGHRLADAARRLAEVTAPNAP